MAEPPPELLDALTETRAVLAGARYPLAVPSAADATATTERLSKQLGDYLLPRAGRLTAPLLVVVGGPTGAGKSTLVNSLVRAPVSAAGALRPTTRAPVLVSHPSDGAWFVEQRLLPGLARTSALRAEPGSLQVISAPALAPGLALLDAPDIDSVVGENRELARQLLGAADLWLFVTTAARYADAVPWQVLRTARERGTALAMVLDRVPPDAGDEITAHLRELLADQRLADIMLFVLPEEALDGSGLISESQMAPLRDFLDAVASDAIARSDVAGATLNGALESLERDLDTLSLAADDQRLAWGGLDREVTQAYAGARTEIETGVSDGALLRGDLLSPWQEFVGGGDLGRVLRARFGRASDRAVAALTGRRSPGARLHEELPAGIATLIAAHATAAGERAATAWAAMPAGTGFDTAALARPRPGLAERSADLVRDWRHGVFDMVALQGTGRGRATRATANSANATGLLVMIGVVASAAYAPTRDEIAVAGGTSATTHKLLDAVFGDDAMRQLARLARGDLLARVEALLDVEAARFGDVRESIELDPTLPERLRHAARSIRDAGPIGPAGGSERPDGTAPRTDEHGATRHGAPPTSSRGWTVDDRTDRGARQVATKGPAASTSFLRRMWESWR